MVRGSLTEAECLDQLPKERYGAELIEKVRGTPWREKP